MQPRQTGLGEQYTGGDGHGAVSGINPEFSILFLYFYFFGAGEFAHW